MNQQLFHVSGLHCQSCVGAVTDALTGIDSVRTVDVTLGTDGPSLVRVESDGPLVHGQVQAALDEDGDYMLVESP